MKGLRLRTELRFFALALIIVVVVDFATGGLVRWSSLPLDADSPVQVRLVPAALLYLLILVVRLALASLRRK